MSNRPTFEVPVFLQNMSAEDIQKRMMQELREDIDDMPGGFAYDYTFTTALIASELVNYYLMRAVMIAFPEYAWDDWLDLHARQVNKTRKAANRASGKLIVAGKAGTVIKAGSIFCTEGTDDYPCMEFSADKEVVIGETEKAEVPITAVLAGPESNVLAGTITLMQKPISGVRSVTNPEDTSGGAVAETDDALYERIYLENTSKNYTGNDSDYIRWAREVQGCGDCIVLPAWNGPGTVKLAIVDSNGKPANETIVKAVYEHIVSPNDRAGRLLPTGCAELTVVAATTVLVSYTCTGIVHDSSTSMEIIIEDFRNAVMKVYSEAKEDGVLIYNKVRGLITSLPGVDDFDTFLMNGSEENIILSREQYPDTGQVQFSQEAT